MNAATQAAVKALTFGYRDRGGVLQSARATIVVLWCLALGVIVALYENPIVLISVASGVLFVAVRCGVIKEVAIVVAIGAPVGILMAMLNPIASQSGVTVLIAGINLPLFGVIDITREAVNYGLILALRSSVIFAICALYVATVDPDDLLRALRRFSVRSAITASLAVRFVPVLARDGMNMAVARECRPGPAPSTSAVVRGIFARSLDRASDSALALETRGYALARPIRFEQSPRRRADWLVLGSALALLAFVFVGVTSSLARFEDYPLTLIAAGPSDLAFAAILGQLTALPALVIPRQKGVAR